jgi:microcystin-dependent protein
MGINLTLFREKGQTLTAEEWDSNLEDIRQKVALLDSPVLQGIPRAPIPGSGAAEDQLATVGWTRELITGSAQQGNLTYALLGASNAFTKPQSAAAALSDGQLVTLAQLKQRGFEAGDIKYSLWPRSGNSGWISFDSTPLPDPGSTDPTKGLYADLFSKIGYTYGGSSALKYFQTPDCRGRVMVGNGAGSGLTARSAGQVFGEELHQLGYNEMVDHAHNYTYTTPTARGLNTGGGVETLSVIGAQSNVGTTGMISKGGQTPFNVIQPSLVVYLLVKL